MRRGEVDRQDLGLRHPLVVVLPGVDDDLLRDGRERPASGAAWMISGRAPITDRISASEPALELCESLSRRDVQDADP